ncbi:MAG: TM2 domain-containing protein [Corynebacterium sp.]|nr:TM2 domain-containing protein [Corynebacterium sp.]
MTVPPNPYAEYDSEGLPVRRRTPPPVPGQPVFSVENLTPAYQAPMPVIRSSKSPTLTWLMALVFGFAGVHDFYTGNRKIGALKVALLIASGMMLDTALDPVGNLVVWVLLVWMFLDVGRVFFGTYTDGDGFPVKYGT